MVKAGSIRRIPPDRELDRRIAALALPALGSIAAEPAYSLADTAIVGHLGRVPLDSLAIATTALTMTAWMAIFLTTATTSAVAGLAASRATDRAARSAGAAYLVAAAGGIAVAVAVIVTAPWVAALLGGHQFGAHQLVFSGSVGYLRASAAGLPFLYVSYAGNGHLIGLADTRTPPFRLRRHAPRDDPRHPRLRPGGGAGPALPRAGPARGLDRPGTLARGPRGAPRPTLAGPFGLMIA